MAGLGNINYHIADVNTITLPTDYYNLVWVSGSVHHVERLEHLFAQVAKALKPDGLFVMEEYIGASQFQFGERQREILHACNTLLPMRYRYLTSYPLHADSAGFEAGKWWLRRLMVKIKDVDLINAVGRVLRRTYNDRRGRPTIRSAVNLPTAQKLIETDPSEAVHSADIVPVLQRDFEIVEYRLIGGSILQFLLADIAGNFDDQDGQELLKMLFVIEDTLMEIGDIPSDFAYIVARPKADQSG